MSKERIIIDDSIIEKINSIFPPSKFNIEVQLGGTTVSIKTTDEQRCLKFVFFQDHIYLALLNKCLISGTESLNLVYALAKLMPNINYIKLVDGSMINICGLDIEFAELKILTKGISWYNSLGYVSDNYDEEKRLNNELITRDYEEFIDEVYKRDFELFKTQNSIEQIMIKIQRFTGYKTDNNELRFKKKVSEYQEIIDNYDKFISDYISKQEEEIRKGIDLYPDVKMSVRDYFNYVWNDVNTNIKRKGCDEETIVKCKWLKNYISRINNIDILHYETENLKKYIERDVEGNAEGGRKRRAKSTFSTFKKSSAKRTAKERAKRTAKERAKRRAKGRKTIKKLVPSPIFP